MNITKTLFSASALLMLMACGESNNQNNYAYVDGETEFVFIEEEEQNVSVSGIIIDKNEHLISVLTESGDTCKFQMSHAESAHRVFGGYELDNHVVVIPGDGDNAQELLNLSTLVGRWVYKNVAQEETGLELIEGGGATSINYDTQNYKNWTTFGTRVVLTWSGDGSDGTSELLDTCEVRFLSQDTLKLTSQYDEALEIQYYRQSNKNDR